MASRGQTIKEGIQRFLGERLHSFVDHRIRKAAKSGNKKQLAQWLWVVSPKDQNQHHWHWQLGGGKNKPQSLISYLHGIAAEKEAASASLYVSYHRLYGEKRAAIREKFRKSKKVTASIRDKQLAALDNKLAQQLLSRRYRRTLYKAQTAYIRLVDTIHSVFEPLPSSIEAPSLSKLQKFLRWLCDKCDMRRDYYEENTLKRHREEVIIAFDEEKEVDIKAKPYEEKAEDIINALGNTIEPRSRIKKMQHARRLAYSANFLVNQFKEDITAFARVPGIKTLESEAATLKSWIKKFVKTSEPLSLKKPNGAGEMGHSVPPLLEGWSGNLVAEYVQQEEYIQDHLYENTMETEHRNLFNHCIDSSFLHTIDNVLENRFVLSTPINLLGVSFNYDNCQKGLVDAIDTLNVFDEVDQPTKEKIKSFTDTYLTLLKPFANTSFSMGFMEKNEEKKEVLLLQRWLMKLKEIAKEGGLQLQISDNALQILMQYGGNLEKTYCYEYSKLCIEKLEGSTADLLRNNELQNYLPLGFALQIDGKNKKLNLLFSAALRKNQLHQKNYPVGRDMVGGADSLPYFVGKVSPVFAYVDFKSDMRGEKDFRACNDKIETPEDLIKKIQEAFETGEKWKRVIECFPDLHFDRATANAICAKLKNLSAAEKEALFKYYKDCASRRAGCQFLITCNYDLIPGMPEYSQGEWVFYRKNWLKNNLMKEPLEAEVMAIPQLYLLMKEKNILLESAVQNQLRKILNSFCLRKFNRATHEVSTCSVIADWLYKLLEEKQDIDTKFFKALVTALYKLEEKDARGAMLGGGVTIVDSLYAAFFINPEESVYACNYEFINFLTALADYSESEVSLVKAIISKPKDPSFVFHNNPGSCIETIRFIQQVISYQRNHSNFIDRAFVVELNNYPFLEQRKIAIAERFKVYTRNKESNHYSEKNDMEAASMEDWISRDMSQLQASTPLEVKRTEDASNKHQKLDEEIAVKELSAGRYDPWHFDTIMRNIKGETRMSKQDQADFREAIERLNAYQEAFQQAMGHWKDHMPEKNQWTHIEYLAYLRQHLYLHSSKKRWLRLEQVVSILFMVRYNALLQIHCSEGKTIINQMAALLLAAEGKKVDVLTHAKEYAMRDCDKTLHYLANTLGLKAVHRYEKGTMDGGGNAIREADIYYCDIYQAIHDKDGASFEGKPQREATAVILDESDNMVIDIDATTTIALGKKVLDNRMEYRTFLDMLSALNTVTDELVAAVQAEANYAALATYADQKAYVDAAMAALSEGSLRRAYAALNPEEQAYWISAALMAKPLTRNEDYVLTSRDELCNLLEEEEKKHEEPESGLYGEIPMENGAIELPCYDVHIMHKETSGRRDEHSHWGQGVHQMVAIRERAIWGHRARIGIPPETARYADCDVKHYVEQYAHRCAVTGTLGGSRVIAVQRAVIENEKEGKPYFQGVIPRAKRQLHVVGEDNKWGSWPRVQTNKARWQGWKTKEENLSENHVNKHGENTLEARYSRRFDYGVQVVQEQDHYARITEGLRGAQNQRLSSLVFFKTVAECEAFNAYLQEHGVHDVQILDDCKVEEGDPSRTPELMIMENAKNAGKITLTTAAGSRATDFKGIEVGIVAKPGTQRVVEQMLARLGRSGALGITYQIYSDKDVPLPAPLGKDKPLPSIKTIKSVDEQVFKKQQWAMQAGALGRIQAQCKLREAKYQLRKEAFASLKEAGARKRRQFQQRWCNFYATVDDVFYKAEAAGQSGREAIYAAYEESCGTVTRPGHRAAAFNHSC